MLSLLLLALLVILLFGGLGVAVSPNFLIVLLVVLLVIGVAGVGGRGRGWY